MSGVVDTVKKVFKNKIVKAIVIAAAIWFTAGTAMAYMAAPELGLGSAMSTSWSSMVTTTTEFFAADAAATGATEAAATGESLAAAGGATATQGEMLAAQTAGMEGAQGTMMAAQEAGMASGAGAGAGGGAGGVTAAEAAGEGWTAGMTAEEAAMAQTADFGVAGDAMTKSALQTGGYSGTVGTPGGGGVLGWMNRNPIPTMMLGQAGVGAYEGYLLDKEQEREDEWRRSRGLMGFDFYGQPGIVQSQVPQQTVDQAVAEPTVSAPAAPTVAGQQAPQQRPVNKADLPKLQKQGLVAQNQV